MKVLKKAIEDDDVDSFHRHLERLVQDHGSTVGDLLAGSGALHCAAKAGCILMVETLIQKGLGNAYHLHICLVCIVQAVHIVLTSLLYT